MSEIADAVQIIRVTYDGIEIAMKMGKRLHPFHAESAGFDCGDVRP